VGRSAYLVTVDTDDDRPQLSVSGMWNSKATGVAAVAGGFAEAYVLVGLAATLICEVGAMALLFRAFSRGHGVRSVFSVLSICGSGLMILLFTLSLWVFWFQSHHAF
jgi:hypothetical protein